MKSIPGIILVIIIGILFKIIVSERWIGNDGERWRTIVEGDGRGYYAYLPAVFIYKDLKFDFVLKDETTIFGAGLAQYPFLANGERGNKYFVGEAVMLAPFFLLSWLISWIFGNSLNGYNQIFFESISIAALFYCVIGLIFTRKLLKLYNIRELWIQVIITMLLFGTNILHYTVYEPSMSHIYSFAAVSGFMYYLKKFQNEKTSKHLVFASFALALIILIRPVNGIIILAIPFLSGSGDELNILFQSIWKNKLSLLLSIIVFTTIIFIQPLIWYLTYGKFLHWSYKGEGFDFLHPHFLDTLFSYRKGLFIYTPFIFISILFSIRYFKKSIFSFTAFIGFFIILNFILSSWCDWYYGGSFSLRAFMEFYPFFILPLANGLNEFKNKISLLLISILFSAILLINLIQTYQYEHNIIHFADMDKDKYWEVFLRTDKKYKFINYPINTDTLIEKDVLNKKTIFNDFEGTVNWGYENEITTEESYSGNHSVKIMQPNSYSPGFVIKYGEMENDKFSFVKVHLMVKTKDANTEAILVVSFEWKSNQIYKYNTCPLNAFRDNSNGWYPVEYGVKFPRMVSSDVMKIYVWNSAKTPVFVDDFKIDLYSLK